MFRRRSQPARERVDDVRAVVLPETPPSAASTDPLVRRYALLVES